MDPAALLDALKDVLLAAGPGVIAKGLYAFLGDLGTWLYDALAPFLARINVVTARPESWTTDLAAVREAWQAMRWLALVLLACLFAGHVAEWSARERQGKSAADLAERLVGLGAAAGGVWISLDLAMRVTAVHNAALSYAVGGVTVTQALPGWEAVKDVPTDTPAGIGKLVFVLLIAFTWGHMLVATAWWDVLLALMPLAIAAAAWGVTAGWFRRWSSAVGGALVAQFALCVALRLVRGLLETASGQLAAEHVGPAVVTLLLGIPLMLVVTKLASQCHAGISALHPFAAVAGAVGAAKGAAVAAGGAVAAPFTGGTSAAAATAATGAAAAGGSAHGGAPVPAAAAPAPAPHAPSPLPS